MEPREQMLLRGSLRNAFLFDGLVNPGNLHQGSGAIPGTQLELERASLHGRGAFGELSRFFYRLVIENKNAAHLALVAKRSGHDQFPLLGEADDVFQVRETLSRACDLWIDKVSLDRTKLWALREPAFILSPNEISFMKNVLLSLIAFALTTIGTVFGQSHAFLWDPATGIRDLGTLGADAWAYAVNDSGTAVGVYAPTDGRFYYHGFIWTETTGMMDIGVPGGGDSDTAEVFCFAINNAGNVVGRARQVDGRQVAFFWSPIDGFTTLGDISTNADNGNSAYAINDLDQVTGNLVVQKPGIIYHAFFWSPDMANPRDLGVVEGAQYSLGNGINNLGRIVGGSLTLDEETFEPMGWKKQSGMKLIGMVPETLYAVANAINDTGQIIGLDQTGTSDLTFYTAPGLGLKFLKGMGGNESVGLAINQSGVIVGYADDTAKIQHAVRWLTPTSVPEVFATEALNAFGINNLGQIVGQAYFAQE